MKLLSAYLAVILIWSTTPLAIKFSAEGLPFILAVGLRMSLAALLCLALMLLRGQRLRLDRASMAAYAAGNVGVFGAMSLSYYAVGFIPSGLLSVMFGVAPLMSGLFAPLLLNEAPMSRLRVVCLLLALGGLALVFKGALAVQAESWPGLVAAIVAAAFFALSGVLVKRQSEHLDALGHTTGTLLLSVPFFLLGWFVAGTPLPVDVPLLSWASVAYLVVFGSVAGFMLYFYVLQALGPTQVALIPLITPVLALALGRVLDNEVISSSTAAGGGLIVLALAGYQFGERLSLRLRRKPYQWLKTAKLSALIQK